MGSYTPPPGQKAGSVRPQPAKTAPPPPEPVPPPDVAPGEVAGSIGIPPPLSATQTTSRLKLPEKKMPLGPKVSTIFGTIVLVALVAFLIMKAPSRLASMQLQKYAGLDSAMLEWGNPRMCGGATGCLTIYLSTDKESEKAIESCIALADDVAEKGIETVFVIGKDNVKSCARLARTIRRQVLFDPQGEWADRMRIKQIPHYIAYTTTGEVKLRTSETPDAASVTGAFQ
jgi:hypothetical protein